MCRNFGELANLRAERAIKRLEGQPGLGTGEGYGPPAAGLDPLAGVSL